MYEWIREYAKLLDSVEGNKNYLKKEKDQVIDFKQVENIIYDFVLRINKELEDIGKCFKLENYDRIKNGIRIIMPSGKIELGKWQGESKIFFDYTQIPNNEDKNKSMYIRYNDNKYRIIDDRYNASYNSPIFREDSLENAINSVLYVLLFAAVN